ncbi:MAG: hypothetical protein U0232_31780 [Thermomicrobiales bacterium]
MNALLPRLDRQEALCQGDPRLEIALSEVVLQQAVGRLRELSAHMFARACQPGLEEGRVAQAQTSEQLTVELRHCPLERCQFGCRVVIQDRIKGCEIQLVGQGKIKGDGLSVGDQIAAELFRQCGQRIAQELALLATGALTSQERRQLLAGVGASAEHQVGQQRERALSGQVNRCPIDCDCGWAEESEGEVWHRSPPLGLDCGGKHEARVTSSTAPVAGTIFRSGWPS